MRKEFRLGFLFGKAESVGGIGERLPEIENYGFFHVAAAITGGR